MAEQELPECPWHPGLLCPGECQYMLGPDDCWHEVPEFFVEKGTNR